MATLLSRSQSPTVGLFGSGVRPTACRSMPSSNSSNPQWAQGDSFRLRDKRAVANNFLDHLRKREGFDVDAPGLVQEVYDHFDSLPTR